MGLGAQLGAPTAWTAPGSFLASPAENKDSLSLLSFLLVGASLWAPPRPQGPVRPRVLWVTPLLARGHCCAPSALAPSALAPGGRGRWAPICLGGVVSSCFLVEELGGFSELMVYVLSPFVFWVC